MVLDKWGALQGVGKKLGSVILRNGFSSHDEESQGKQILRLRLRMTRRSKFFGCARVTVGG